MPPTTREIPAVRASILETRSRVGLEIESEPLDVMFTVFSELRSTDRREDISLERAGMSEGKLTFMMMSKISADGRTVEEELMKRELLMLILLKGDGEDCSDKTPATMRRDVPVWMVLPMTFSLLKRASARDAPRTMEVSGILSRRKSPELIERERVSAMSGGAAMTVAETEWSPWSEAAEMESGEMAEIPASCFISDNSAGEKGILMGSSEEKIVSSGVSGEAGAEETTKTLSF